MAAGQRPEQRLAEIAGITLAAKIAGEPATLTDAERRTLDLEAGCASA